VKRMFGKRVGRKKAMERAKKRRLRKPLSMKHQVLLVAGIIQSKKLHGHIVVLVPRGIPDLFLHPLFLCGIAVCIYQDVDEICCRLWGCDEIMPIPGLKEILENW
jgi:hypothetical protein